MDGELEWRPYDLANDHTVVGDVRVSEPISAPECHADRHLLAYLPPSYEASDDDYPVLYMHDGQNLFDEVTSHSGEWRVDETMERLAAEGREAIIVGIPNAGEERGREYAPYPHPEHGGGDADAYLAFLLETVKPLVDASFRTRPDRAHTGLTGSSLGGLVSLYGFFTHPDRVGFAGVMSPALWWSGEAIFDDLTGRSRTDGRLYVDVGGREAPDDPALNEAYLRDAKRLVERLRERGYDRDRLRFVVDEDAEHHEAAWAERFPDAARFLLP